MKRSYLINIAVRVLYNKVSVKIEIQLQKGSQHRRTWRECQFSIKIKQVPNKVRGVKLLVESFCLLLEHDRGVCGGN